MIYCGNSAIACSFIFAVLAFSIILFFCSEELCPVDTFKCSLRGECIPKSKVCDGNIDCPNEADEDPVLCAEQYNNVSQTGTYINFKLNPAWWTSRKINECRIENTPSECICKYSRRLFCKDVAINFTPHRLSTLVTHLNLSNKSMTNISTEDFVGYENVTIIHLEDNNLETIQPYVFKNLVYLTKLYLMRNKLISIEKCVFAGLTNLQWLFLDFNNLKSIYLNDFEDLVHIEWISFSYNKLKFDGENFPLMPNLFELYIDNNEMETIGESTFALLSNIELLSIRNNKIKTIDENAFKNLTNLKELDLHGNDIQYLPSTIFHPLINLKRLYLGSNSFECMPSNVFHNLQNLAYLNLEEIRIRNINTLMFIELVNLKSVVFRKYNYCRYVQFATRCRPLSDGISSSTQLLSKPLFFYTNWVICFATCSFNIMVFFGRCLFRDENKVLSLIIRNLAVSDFLMGIYLLLIGIQDLNYRDIYHLEAQNWVSSWGCTMTGILAMVSSEVSVLLLVFMSVDRFLVIAIPYGRYNSLARNQALWVLIIIWIFGIVIAVFPVFVYFSTTRFYGVNGLCFPLHIHEPYVDGWQYSAVIFFGINGTSLLIILIVYTGMFVSIWKTRNATNLPETDYQIAIKFFFIVITDVACWLPMIIVKAAAIMGVTISADLYGWLVVFVLPINSSLNPILYTFTTAKYRTHIIKKFPSLIKKLISVTKCTDRKNSVGESDDLSVRYGNRKSCDSGTTNITVVEEKY